MQLSPQSVVEHWFNHSIMTVLPCIKSYEIIFEDELHVAKTGENSEVWNNDY